MSNIVKQALRIRAYPRPAQQRLLNSWFAASRWVWNWSLGYRDGGDLDVDGAVVNAPCEASAGKLSRSRVRNAA